MELKFLKSEKNEAEIEFSNLTLIEIVRVYLNKQNDVTFAAWKREHNTVNPILKIKTKSKDVKSVLKEVISEIVKDLDSVAAEFKSLK